MSLASLFVETSAATLLAPMTGVALASWMRARGSAARPAADVPRCACALIWRSGIATITFLLLCATANAVVERSATVAISAPLLLTLGASFMGLLAVGTVCGSVCDDPLDGVACALAISMSAAFGIFAFGPLVTNMPAPLLMASLAFSPIVATASAAGIDLFRSGPLYQLSPLAHTQFAYPAWTTASLLSVSVAMVCLAATTQRLTAGGRTISARRMTL